MNIQVCKQERKITRYQKYMEESKLYCKMNEVLLLAPGWKWGSCDNSWCGGRRAGHTVVSFKNLGAGLSCPHREGNETLGHIRQGITG